MKHAFMMRWMKMTMTIHGWNVGRTQGRTKGQNACSVSWCFLQLRRCCSTTVPRLIASTSGTPRGNMVAFLSCPVHSSFVLYRISRSLPASFFILGTHLLSFLHPESNRFNTVPFFSVSSIFLNLLAHS